MTIEELLEELEGNGLVITDWDLIINNLSWLGLAPFDEISEPHKNDVKLQSEE